MLRLLWIGACALVLITPAAARGQDYVTVQLGAGPTLSAVDWYDNGVHILGGISLWLGGHALGIRVDGVASTARHVPLGLLPGDDPDLPPRWIDKGYQSITGGSLSLTLRKRSGRTRPYGYAGIGYYESPWSEYHTRKHKLGPTGGFGLIREIRGIDWFVEISARVFGNTFADGQDRMFAPLTVGVKF